MAEATRIAQTFSMTEEEYGMAREAFERAGYEVTTPPPWLSTRNVIIGFGGLVAGILGVHFWKG